MREAESLCAENIGLKDIARNRRGELIMYYRPRIIIRVGANCSCPPASQTPTSIS